MPVYGILSARPRDGMSEGTSEHLGLGLYRANGCGPCSVEVAPLMLAVAFSLNALVPVAALRSATAAQVPELVRPPAAALRTVRELHGLGVSLTLAGDVPSPVLKRVAQVLWLSGDVVAEPDIVGAILSRVSLPPSCIWFVTADGDEAGAAAQRGMNAIEISEDRQHAIEQPDARGIIVAHAIDDVLEIVRIPYTRAALTIRFMIRQLLDPSLAEDVAR
jgi:hypothetical protein